MQLGRPDAGAGGLGDQGVRGYGIGTQCCVLLGSPTVPTSLLALGPCLGCSCEDPSAEYGHQEPQPHPGLEKASSPALYPSPRAFPSQPGAPHLHPPSPSLACPSRLPPPASPQPHCQRREKSLILGWSSGRGPKRPAPTHNPSPDRGCDSTEGRAPHLLWPLGIPQGVLDGHTLQDPIRPCLSWTGSWLF